MFSEVLIPYRDRQDDVAVGIGAAMAEIAGTKSTVLLIQTRRHSAEIDDLEACLATNTSVDVLELEERRFQSDALLSEACNRPGALICVASHGRNRTAVITGGLANDVLVYGSGPVVVCGPQSSAEAFRAAGPVLAALDGSAEADASIPLADDWASTLSRSLEIVTVLPEEPPSPELAHAIATGDVEESSYLHNVGRHHAELHGHDVTYDVLHGDPAKAIVEEATSRNVSLVVLATRAPLGIDRLLHGSVTDRVVHNCPAPVLAVRTSDGPK